MLLPCLHSLQPILGCLIIHDCFCIGSQKLIQVSTSIDISALDICSYFSSPFFSLNLFSLFKTYNWVGLSWFRDIKYLASELMYLNEGTQLSFLVNHKRISLSIMRTLSLWIHQQQSWRDFTHIPRDVYGKYITQVFWINDLLQKRPFPEQLLSKQKR